MPKVSVIIPTYNYAHYICEAIDSVLAQTYKDFEIVIVDDGSTDNTKEVLNKYKDKIRYIYQRNKGLAAARNTGIKASKGEYLQFLDADDYITPGKLAIQSRLLDTHPETGWVYSNCYFVNNNGDIQGDILNIHNRHNTKLPEREIFQKYLILDFILPVHAPMIRKKCTEVEFFDESLTAQEDYDFWLRMAAKYRVKGVNKYLAFYRQHKGSMATDFSQIASNRIHVIHKIIKLYPDLVQLSINKVNKMLADLHNFLGFKYYREERFKESKSELLNSIKAYPFQKKAYLYLLMAFLRSLKKF